MKKTTLTLIVMLFTILGFSQTYNFSTAGASGRFGPDQLQVDAAYTGTTLDGNVTITTQGIQEWTVPSTGDYSIQAMGAQGGNHLYTIDPEDGGLGSSMTGTFTLTAGQILHVVVGQQGGQSNAGSSTNFDNAAPGGGGGTFTWDPTNLAAPLVAAGGGSGGSSPGGYAAIGSNATTNGNNAESLTNGGTAGNGGNANNGGSSYWAGGGAGWLTDGTGGNNITDNVFTPGSQGAEGGRSPLNNAQGGLRWNDTFDDEGGDGGFGGGGGGGSDNMGSGGGGGYSGGGGGRGGNAFATGGGGGSFNGGTDQTNTPAINTGDGSIIITKLCDNLTVNVTPGDNVCTGTAVTITATSINAGTITWDNGITNGVAFTPAVTTTYTSTSTDPDDCVETITITVDATPPTISCPANIAQANDAGVCGAVITYTTPVGMDNCPSTTAQTAGLPSGATFPVGTTTNTYVVTDSAGLTATCSFDVTITDTEAPTITCIANIVQSNDAGLCDAVVTFASPTIADNCFSLGSQTFTFTGALENFTVPAGVTEIQITASGGKGGDGDGGLGGGGATMSGSFAVSPGDILDVVVGDAGLQFGNSGGGGAGSGVILTGTPLIVAGGGGGAAIDALGNPGVITEDGGNSSGLGGTAGSGGQKGYVGGDCGWASGGGGFTGDGFGGDGVWDGGALPGTLSGTGAGFSWTNGGAGGTNGGCTFTFPNAGTWGLGGGGAGSYGGAGGGGYSGGGGGQYVDADPLSHGGGGGGSFNSGTAQTNTAGANMAQGEVTISYIAGTFTLVQTTGLASGSTFPLGTTTNTFLLTDGAGLTATCSFDVTIEDNEDPVITCVPNGTRDTEAGVCEYTVVGTEFDATFTDNCITGVITNDLNATATIAGEILPKGDTTVVWTVDDGNGQTATCTTVITVEDNEDPIITCIPNGTRDTDLGVCEYTVVGTEFDATFTDNCTDGTVSNDLNGTATIAGEVLAKGDTTVVWTVDDGNGQTATCTTVITVEDNEDPIITCAPNGTRDTNAGVCEYTVVGTEFDATFTDNCTDGTISNDLNGTATIAGEVLAKGDTTVVWTVDDGNGQTATCTTVITVEDNEDPVITCAPSDTRDTDPGVCQYTVVGTEFDATFTDNCTDGSITNDLNGTDTVAGEILPTGDTTVVWTVDDGNGQTATCTTVITVEDNEVPTIACPMDVTANTDFGVCGALVIYADAIALDNCGVDTVMQTAGLPSGSTFPVGINTVEYTATDINGNVSVCSFTITVTDNEPAMAVCQDITIQLDANGDAMIVAADVDGGSTDNCGVASIAVDMDTFDCSNVGPNDVTLEVTDVNGNVSTCIAVVTVEDVTMPDVVCMDITVQLDATGSITILGSDVDGGSTDACGIASYDLDIDTFDCSNVGPNDVVLTVTDVNGNSATCMAVVTVEDTTMPVLVCMDITLELGADGTAMITPADVSTVTDACGISTTAVDIENFDCSDIGTPVTVMVFAVDNNGNLESCTAVVTVIDALAPVVTCPADQTVDPGVGNLFYEVPDYFALGEATATDNCTDPLTIFSQDPAVGTLLPDGTYTITMTAEDEYGNVGECTFELTVESVLGIGDNELSFESVVLYPNPAQEFVILSNPQSLALQQAAIYDLTGRLIQTIDLNDMGTEKTIDVSLLATATYAVVIQTENGQITKQLLKE